MAEFYSFDEVLKILQMEQEDLESLVSEGEIQAFRNDAEMQFLKKDIDDIKNRRMNDATLLVGSGDEEVSLIEDYDEIDPISEDEDELREALEDSDDSFVHSENFVNLGERFTETRPLLEMGDEEKKIKVSVSKDNRNPDTDELFFEDSADDLLDTGELLFDSVNQVLPQDRTEAELFTESEMGISSEYDDIDEGKVKAAIDFLDQSEEEIISTSRSKTSSLSESRYSRQAKTFAGIIVGIIAIVVLAVFAFFSPDPLNKKEIAISLHTVSYQTFSETMESFPASLEAIAPTEVKTQLKGTLKDLELEGLVENQIDIAKIEVSSGPRVSPEKQQQLESLLKQKKSFDAAEALVNQNKKVAGQLWSKYKALSAQGKSAEDFFEYIKRKYNKYYNLSKATHEYVTTKKKIKGVISKIETLQKEIGSAKPSTTTTTIQSPSAGILKWMKQESDSVQPGDILCTITSLSTLKCSLRVSKTDALQWQKGQSIRLNIEEMNDEVEAIVQSVRENTATQPVTIEIEVLVDNSDSLLKPDMKAKLVYEKQIQLLAVPKSAFLEDATVYVVDGKDKNLKVTEKKKLKLKKLDNDDFVATSGEELREGDVVIKKVFSYGDYKAIDLKEGFEKFVIQEKK